MLEWLCNNTQLAENVDRCNIRHSRTHQKLTRALPSASRLDRHHMQPSRAVSWALAPLLLLCLACGTDSRPLLAAPDAPQCGNPAEHCKPKGAACTLQTISECIPPYKCRGGVCSEVPTSAAQAAPKSSPDTSPKNSTKEMAASGGEDGSGEDVPAAEATGADGGTACGEPPEHCKPKGADCMLRKVSECVKGLRCDKDTKKCVDRAGGDSKGGDGEGEGEGEGDASQPGDSGEGGPPPPGDGKAAGAGEDVDGGGVAPESPQGTASRSASASSASASGGTTTTTTSSSSSSSTSASGG